MDALDRLLLNKGQTIHIEIRSIEINVQGIKIYFGCEPSIDLLEPIFRCIDAGMRLSAFSTNKFKSLDLSNTVYTPDEIGITLAETWKEQGYQVTISTLSSTKNK
ncbi:hypothetical protein Lepto7375DRAFT_7189 [Leptolyngbya sp. PCC 7375]|nr:hypothetical protein Lepto7375DRAFT_7189 [Leptolyngbya sp. PCC 7375]